MQFFIYGQYISSRDTTRTNVWLKTLKRYKKLLYDHVTNDVTTLKTRECLFGPRARECCDQVWLKFDKLPRN